MRALRAGAAVALVFVAFGVGVANGSDGEPLILGQENEAQTVTSLVGPGGLDLTTRVGINELIVGSMFINCSGTFVVPAGSNSGNNNECGHSTGLVFAMVVGPTRSEARYWVREGWIEDPDEPSVWVRLNRRAATDVTVAYVVLDIRSD